MQLFIYSSVALISGVVLLVMFVYRHKEITTGKVYVPARVNIKERLPYFIFTKLLLLEKEFLAYVSKIIRWGREYDWDRVANTIKSNPVKNYIEKLIQNSRTKGTRGTSSYFKEISEHKEKIRNGNDKNV